jgi:mono/diheme cytochrome c family protein
MKSSIKATFLAGALAAGVSALALVAIAKPAPSPAVNAKPIAGAAVDDFQLVAQDGVAYQLKYFKTAKAIVVVSQVNGDAGSRAAMKAVEAMKAQYPGVEFMFLNSALPPKGKDNRDAIADEAKAQNISLPILDDSSQLTGEALGVTVAGEAFVVDPKTWKVAYHGPVAKLSAALDAVVAGAPVPSADVAAKGTKIAFPARGAKLNVSYAKDVAPILEAKCVACHSPNSIAPWAMTSYEMVKGYAPMVREAIKTDRMPPYNADPHVGQFQMDEELSTKEAQTIVRWIEAGAPRGEGDDPLKAAVKPRADWPLGKPDLVVDVPAYSVPASGVVDYQTPAVNNTLTEGKWLYATTFKPGDRKGVHHILAGWIPKLPEGGKGNFSWDISMGGYAVGNESNTAPQGWATWVPAGGALSFQMHYTPYGKAYNDASKVAFYFQDKAPERMMRQIVVVDPTIEILPNAGRHHERAYVKFPGDAYIYGAQPHAHYRGYSSKLTMITPDGKETLLLNMPKYDFGYQREYVFKDLIKVPAGSTLVADYLYDNSKNNPANPDPSATVHWGDQSFEEMLFTAIRFRWADETPAHKRDDLQKGLEATQLFGAVDDSMDGKLQLAELKSPMLKPFRDNFAMADTDHDGSLSPKEFQAASEYMQKMQAEHRASRNGGADEHPAKAPTQDDHAGHSNP